VRPRYALRDVTGLAHIRLPRTCLLTIGTHGRYTPGIQWRQAVSAWGLFMLRTKWTLIVLPLAFAGLSGCAVYPAAGYGYSHGTYGDRYGQPGQSSIYIHGGSRVGRPGYDRRDQDRDRIPDRVDRDIDGDGVGNRFDRRPRDPRYR